MAFLNALAKEDLGVFVAGKEYIGVQNMRERFSQNITLRTAFGSVHPIIRTKTPADSSAVSFSFLLLKSGVAKGMNSYTFMQQLEDFKMQTQKGNMMETYEDCNWTDIDIDSQQDSCTVSMDVMVPGFVPDFSASSSDASAGGIIHGGGNTGGGLLGSVISGAGNL